MQKKELKKQNKTKQKMNKKLDIFQRIRERELECV